MGYVTLFWEDDLEESFDLIAIHCSEEAFKMAYLLNQFTDLKLIRCKKDLDLIQHKKTVYFPVFSYKDIAQHTDYYLIQNKSHPTEEEEKEENLTSLFADNPRSYYLVPQYKRAEFFIKIAHENEHYPIKNLISRITKIRQVVSVYVVDVSLLKSKNNLIFDLC